MHKKLILEFLVIVLLIALTSPLRFINLGYSEFQDDEKKAFFRFLPDENVFNFVIRQRKGPMQFVVSYIPYLATHDFRNEFAERLPFAIINTASVVVLYLLLTKLTKNKLAAFFGALLFAANGLIVGFSRIAQYQNLNLFFSFLSLYFYADLADKEKHLIRMSGLGTLFYCLSVLSHWDAVFYLVPIIYFFVKFLLRKDLNAKYKRNLILINLGIGSAILLPFLIPYIRFHTSNSASAEYFGRRVGFSTYGLEKHRYIFELYNPFITLPLYLTLGTLALVTIRKHYLYILWFVVNFLAIRYYMAKPGTHLYNYLIPLIFMYAFWAAMILDKVTVFTKILFVIMALGIYSALFYQSYMLFVDHSVEYPWESKLIFGHLTKPYIDREILTFGFPHYRGWKKVNEFVTNYNNTCGYLTNEGKEISQIYIDLNYGDTKNCYYIINVKKPFITTRDGVIFAGATKKIYQYEDRGIPWIRVYIRGL